MRDQSERRRSDFEKRVRAAPSHVYILPYQQLRYIPIHCFAEETADGRAPAVDAWCELGGDIALIECSGQPAAVHAPGIWIRRDEKKPCFLKVRVSLPGAQVTRKDFEEAFTKVAKHPLSQNGFADIQPGAHRIRLDPE